MYANSQFHRALRQGFRNGAMGMGDHARIDQPLTNEELQEYAPSVFAREAHSSRSQRFAPIATIELVEGLRAEGFLPFQAKQAKTRDEGRIDFTKHLIRFRRQGDGNGTYHSGDAIAEIVLVNANDGTSSYQLYGGLFRTLCFNGLIVADSRIQSVRIGHKGNVLDNVIEGSYQVLEQTRNALEVRDAWAAIGLTGGEQMALAEAVHQVRFDHDDATGEALTPIKPAQLLGVRRHEDAGKDLWTTFNVIQENTLRGGLSGRTKAGYDEATGKFKPSRRVSTKPVRGIDQDVKLNKAMWALAEKMAELKSA